jgi:hypothetical protein
MGIPQVSDRIKEAPAHALRALFSGFGQLLLAAERLRHQTDDAAPGARPGAGPGAAPAAGTAGPATMQATAATATPAAATPAAAKPAAAAGPPAERRRSLDLTGNVRILSPDDPAEDPAPSSAAPVSPAPSSAAPVPPAPAPAPAPPVPVAADPAGTTVAEEASAVAPSQGATTQQPEAPIADQSEAAAAPGTPEPAGTASAALPVPGYDGLSLPSLRARLRTLDAGQLRVLIAYEQDHAGRADVLAMFERRITKLAAE